jgi:hypothetical protein
MVEVSGFLFENVADLDYSGSVSGIQLGLGIRIQIQKGINVPNKDKRKKLQYFQKLEAVQ